MKDYFEGTFNQLGERAKHLLKHIPIGLPREFQLLEQRCRNEISEIIDSIENLRSANLFHNTNIQSDLLRILRKTVGKLDHLELVGIAALNRANQVDAFLNQLLDNIRQEINYPLLPPVITTLSQGYFYIYTDLNLLCVPPGEAEFILHLPDLYHELAHPIIEEKLDPKVQSFRNQLHDTINYVHLYLLQELQKEKRRRSPPEYSYYLESWIRSWANWGTEFFCDLFALFTLGPAYAWANIHLCAKRSSDFFRIPYFSKSTHPPDDARMRTMILALRRSEYHEVAQNIEARWADLINISGTSPCPQYFRCFPDHIIKRIVQSAYCGTQQIGSRIASRNTSDPIHSLLNEAWLEFWKNPKEYSIWEKATVGKLRTICSMPKSL